MGRHTSPSLPASQGSHGRRKQTHSGDTERRARTTPMGADEVGRSVLSINPPGGYRPRSRTHSHGDMGADAGWSVSVSP